MGLKSHFGETLALEPQVAQNIERYLTENAADRSDRRGAEVILYQLPDSAVPTRVTDLPLMRQRHVVIRYMMDATLGTVKVKSLTNCDACHERASTGSFAYNEIVVPGVTKIVRPGGQF
jgi:hypothetical protein